MAWKVRYKFGEDTQWWPVCPDHVDKKMALALFNSGPAQKEGLGQFRFDPDGFTLIDYYLVSGDETQYLHLSKA